MYSGLLPPSSSALERALSTAVQKDIPIPIRSLKSASDCPAVAIPWLAWERGINEWPEGLSEKEQRALIKESINQHRRRGTAGAVEEALSNIGFSKRIQEWHKQHPPGAPYTYRLLISVDQVGYRRADLQKMLSVLESSKNLRSHLETIAPKVVSNTAVFESAIALSGSEIQFSAPAGSLQLNGTWSLNGSQTLSGMKS